MGDCNSLRYCTVTLDRDKTGNVYFSEDFNKINKNTLQRLP